MFRLPAAPFSTSMTRRQCLTLGALSLGGLTLPELWRLRAEGAVRPGAGKKSVIMVYLPGGASHIDMYDLKPDAPVEYRGEFRPIRTNVPGMEVCELMPEHARIADKFAIIRGLKTRGNHDPTELLTGVPAFASGNIGQNARPAIGSVVSRLRGANGPIPPYVSVSSHKLLASYDDPENPSYLGSEHRPIRLSGEALQNLSSPEGVDVARLGQRKQLLAGLDRRPDPQMKTYTARALEMVSSSAVRQAFDISAESEAIRQRYGEGFDPSGQCLDFLRARRLVEAGVSLVSIAARFPIDRVAVGVNDPGGWDTHATNFRVLRGKLPQYDKAVAALISDLHDRGLGDDVAVVVWSEFGRQPRVGNVTPDGRGHWPAAACALLAGGGLKTGQIIGETDRLGEHARSRPYTPQDILATLYHVLGIDLNTTLNDQNGRPQYLIDKGRRIDALV
ncbi:DUF1501 domain-containing protein [Lignipirellula cremea]|uniref:DUF1501 domain-containing protein n=1 Tax=Lignipirellula cremea TaxID=2528010 RepID=A0A518DNH0_9BACT|nr:DUF1501 domain-containing protein [Lignipirellula cremea]QDU93384.1 hypothetical protein Pla8534_11640 [Lignipirellula cremea]